MNSNSQNTILRFLQQVAERFPNIKEPDIYTDIHIRVAQNTGSLVAFDDEDSEIAHCTIDEWNNTDCEPEEFYNTVTKALRKPIAEQCSNLGIIRPYNFVLESESGNHIAELYVADDNDTMLIGTPFMQNLSEELDTFINDLLKD